MDCLHCYCQSVNLSNLRMVYKLCCKCMDSKVKYVDIFEDSHEKTKEDTSENTKMKRYMDWLHKWIRTIQWRRIGKSKQK